MRKIASVVFVVLTSLVALGQNQDLPPVPVRPTCTPLFSGGACQSQWNQYNQQAAQYNQALAQQQYQQKVRDWAQQQQAAHEQQLQAAASEAAGRQAQAVADARMQAYREKSDESTKSFFGGMALGAAGFGLGMFLLKLGRKGEVQ